MGLIPDRVDAETSSRCRLCVPYAHDRLTAGVELARQRRDRAPVPEPALDLPPLILREAQEPAERLAFSLRSAQAQPAGPLRRKRLIRCFW